jgi:hypothetical protein
MSTTIIWVTSVYLHLGLGPNHLGRAASACSGSIFRKLYYRQAVVVFVKSDVERTAEIRARIGRDISNRIDFPRRSSMSPIPGVPFSDFLEIFNISLEEMLPEIRSGRLVITIQTDTGDEGNEFITPAHLHAWVNNPQTPASLRNRAMARVKTKMN